MTEAHDFVGIAWNIKTQESRDVHVNVEEMAEWDLACVSPCSGPCTCRVELDGECPQGWPSKYMVVIDAEVAGG